MINKTSLDVKSYLNFVDRKDFCLTALATVVATAAIITVGVSLFSILGNMGPMVGWNSNSTLLALAGGGSALSAVLLAGGITLMRSRPKSSREATSEEWKAKFPKNALKRLKQKKMMQTEPLSTLTPEQKTLLEDKLKFIYLTTTNTRGENKAEENGVHVHASGDHIVFEVKGIEGLIFKVAKDRDDDKEVAEYLKLREEGREICQKKNLYLMHIPACSSVKLSNGRHVIIERKIPNLQGNTAFQRDLYEWGWNQPELKPYFRELFSQLLLFICTSKFGDCKYNNIPLSIDGFLGLIDLDNWGAGAGLLRSFAGDKRNITYSNHGLLNYLPEELLDEFISEINGLLGKAWLSKFIDGHVAGDPWISKLARKALGPHFNAPERIQEVLEEIKQHPEGLIPIIAQLPEESELIREIAKVILACPSFMTAQITQKAAQIKENPAVCIEELKKKLEADEGNFHLLCRQFLIDRKVIEIRNNPQLIFELVRNRIQKHAKRRADFSIYLKTGGAEPLGAYEEGFPTVSNLRKQQKIHSILDFGRIYLTAQLILEYAEAAKSEPTVSGKETADLYFQQLWSEGGKHMSIYANRRQSIVLKGGQSMMSNLDPALQFLKQQGCIFTYKYQFPDTGAKGSEYVTVEF